jgi:DNA-binding NarL/FixJ family response regulator
MEAPSDSVFANVEELNQISDLAIVSQFNIDRSQFLVVALESYAAAQQNSTSRFSIAPLDLTTVGRLEDESNCYLIVKIQAPIPHPDAALVELLTERELQIATLAALGKSNKQIAHHLQISEWTVSAHLRRIFIKLHVDNRAAMVYRCASSIDRRQLYPD